MKEPMQDSILPQAPDWRMKEEKAPDGCPKKVPLTSPNRQERHQEKMKEMQDQMTLSNGPQAGNVRMESRKSI